MLGRHCGNNFIPMNINSCSCTLLQSNDNNTIALKELLYSIPQSAIYLACLIITENRRADGILFPFGDEETGLKDVIYGPGSPSATPLVRTAVRYLWLPCSSKLPLRSAPTSLKRGSSRSAEEFSMLCESVLHNISGCTNIPKSLMSLMDPLKEAHMGI